MGDRPNNGDDVKEGGDLLREEGRNEGRGDRSVRVFVRSLFVFQIGRTRTERNSLTLGPPQNRVFKETGVVSFGKSEEQNKWEARGL